MATQPWKYISNTFYSNTVESIKKALTLTMDHLAKLTANESDAVILSIKTAFLPFHNAFVTSYNQLQSKLGIYKGKTQTFEEMVHEMAYEKLNEWRGQVFAVFAEGTANATAIFPQDRKPFQQGTYDERVEAVATLATTLATYTGQPALITLGTAVDAYYTTLMGARALQQTDEGSTDTLRTNLKANHKLLCTALYRNLGGLMAKYAETPETIANYYDLTLLRDTGSSSIILNGDAAANSIISVIKPTSNIPGVTPDTVVRLKNTSANPVTLIFYGADSETDPPGAGVQFTLAQGQTLDKTIAEVGQGSFDFFNVQNVSAQPGSWEIEVFV